MSMYVVCLRLDGALPLHLYIKCVVLNPILQVIKDFTSLRKCPSKCDPKFNYMHNFNMILYYVTCVFRLV